jgi:hypothetical protein
MEYPSNGLWTNAFVDLFIVARTVTAVCLGLQHCDYVKTLPPYTLLVIEQITPVVVNSDGVVSVVILAVFYCWHRRRNFGLWRDINLSWRYFHCLFLVFVIWPKFCTDPCRWAELRHLFSFIKSICFCTREAPRLPCFAAAVCWPSFRVTVNTVNTSCAVTIYERRG